jgi:RNA 3'-terminal phosphate cyclase (ATP)
VEGGTHNPYAPPFDFLARSFLPVLNQMGPNVSIHLDRAGFFPAGGGQLTVSIEPHSSLRAIDLLERGPISRRHATAVVAKLPRHIAERELAVIQRKLGWTVNELSINEVKSAGPGNVVMLELVSEQVTEVATSFGMRGVRAETVANRAVQQLQRYLAADVPVGEYLADQLIVVLAVANGGSFRTLQPSRHTATNIQVLRQFLGINITTRQLGEDAWLVEVKR